MHADNRFVFIKWILGDGKLIWEERMVYPKVVNNVYVFVAVVVGVVVVVVVVVLWGFKHY